MIKKNNTTGLAGQYPNMIKKNSATELLVSTQTWFAPVSQQNGGTNEAPHLSPLYHTAVIYEKFQGVLS